jgi:ribosomal protein S18 acetylase RimI-like enzyme
MDAITIRPAVPDDASGIARVHVDAWRTTYRGIMPAEVLANLSYAGRERMWRRNLETAGQDGTVQYVAECSPADSSDTARSPSGEIVGFAAGGPERSGDPDHTGEVYAIYLLEPYQRRGVGWRLFCAVTRRLAEAGMRSLLVWVAAQNPSRRFYEALGGVPVRERQEESGGAPLAEVAYGWSDVAPLLTRLTPPA